MRVGVLALQGAFAEHERLHQERGDEVFEIRQLADLKRPIDLLVLPGGESTVQAKLLHDLGLFEPMKRMIASGLPTIGTCAGLILLANHLKVLPVEVSRNAYGRQLGSFSYTGRFNGRENVKMTFIRAPAITRVSPEVEVLSDFEGRATAVRYRNITAYCWHPELGTVP